MNKITWGEAQALCNEHEDHVTSFMRGWNAAVDAAERHLVVSQHGSRVSSVVLSDGALAVDSWKELNARMDKFRQEIDRLDKELRMLSAITDRIDDMDVGPARVVRHGDPVKIVQATYRKHDEEITGTIL